MRHVKLIGLFLVIFGVILLLTAVIDFFVVDIAPASFALLGQSVFFVKAKSVIKGVLSLVLIYGSIRLMQFKKTGETILSAVAMSSVIIATLEAIVTYRATLDLTFLQLLFFPLAFYGAILWYVHTKQLSHHLH